MCKLGPGSPSGNEGVTLGRVMPSYAIIAVHVECSRQVYSGPAEPEKVIFSQHHLLIAGIHG